MFPKRPGKSGMGIEAVLQGNVDDLFSPFPHGKPGQRQAPPPYILGHVHSGHIDENPLEQRRGASCLSGNGIIVNRIRTGDDTFQILHNAIKDCETIHPGTSFAS